MRCSIDDCNSKPVGRGWCSKHYQRWSRYGDPTYETKPYEEHGLKKGHSTEYIAWKNLKSRCYNQSHKSYSDYGGRGITMCDEWKHSAQAFYDYVGDRPSRNYSIDRIDVNGNYEPGNVRWATRNQQAWNRRKVTYNTSGYIGVCWDKKAGKWLAQIDRGNHATVYLGRYDDIEEAALSYDKAAIFFRGSDAVTNLL